MPVTSGGTSYAKRSKAPPVKQLPAWLDVELGAVQRAIPSGILVGSGAPSDDVGNNGYFYFRSDTPGTAMQRIYVKDAGAWTAIL